eukprot:jgi/Bigna1/147099/aug1.129_g21807
MQLSNSGSKAKQDDWEINAEKLKFIFLRGGVLSSGGAAGNSFNFGKKEAATIGTSDSSVRRKEEEIKKLDQIIPTSNTGYFRPKFELGYAPEELKIREQLVSPRVKKRSIFVGNLPLEFKTQDLIKLVKPYGELENCFVCLGEKAQLEGWRYGFAIFKSLEGAQRCYMELNSVTMNGQNLIVEPSRFNPEFEKHEDYL